MRCFAILAAFALVAINGSAGAQVVFDPAEDQAGYVIEKVNPRAAQLLRALDPCCTGKLIPGEQFQHLDRPYKNGGVWSTSPYTIMKKVSSEMDDPNYFEMKQQLKAKQADPTQQAKDNAPPSPRAIIKIPVEPERKPINPNADQGRITIRPWKAEKNTAVTSL